MGKYDVDITVRATDAVGPALQSASKKLNGFQDSFVNKAAKTLATLGGVEAGFKGLAGAVDLLRGDTEGAMRAFESLPFGIGPAIGAIRSFTDAAGKTNERLEKMAELFERIRNSRIEDMRADRLRTATDDEKARIAIEDEFRKRIDQAKADLKELIQKRDVDARTFGEYDLAHTRVLQQETRIRELQGERITRLKELEQQQTDALRDAGMKRLEEENKQAKARIEAKAKEMAEDIRLNKMRDDALRRMAEIREKDLQDIIEAREKRAVGFGAYLAAQQRDPEGRASLAAGSQSRFLTGAADVARDRIAAQQANDVKPSKELLTKAVTILDTIARSPFGVKVGIL